MKTMICLILDRSGSMSGRETDVIGGVNGFIEKQKALPDPAAIAFVRFDTSAIERFRPMQDLHAVMPLNNVDYVPSGGTPLLDAVAETLLSLENDWSRERPDRAIVVIVTDGMENSSRSHSKAQVRRMIEARQESGKWAFIYLGADVDAFHEGAALGIWASNTAGYMKSAAGIGSSYNTVSETVSHIRATGQTAAQNLGGTIREDGTLDKTGSTAAAPETVTKIPTWKEPATGAWTPPE